MPIKYIEGDLFNNIPKQTVIIPHICNDCKRWGSGFVVPLGNTYPKAKESYLSWQEGSLAHTQLVECENNVTVANMVAQRDTRPTYENDKEIPPIRYEALRVCMFDVQKRAKDTNAKIICPMFGSGLAGGDWKRIERMIHEIWKDLDVTVFYFNQFLPKGFNPIDRTEKNVAQDILDDEDEAIESCDKAIFELNQNRISIENNSWPHVNRNVDIHKQEAIAALHFTIFKIEALKSTLSIQRIQERNIQ